MSCSASSTDRQRSSMASFIFGIWEQIRECTSADNLLFGLGLFLGSFFGSFLGFGFAVSLTWVTKGAQSFLVNNHPKPASSPRRFFDPDFNLHQDGHHLPTLPLRRSISEDGIVSPTEVGLGFRHRVGNNRTETTGGNLIAWKEGLHREGPKDAHSIYRVSLTSGQGMNSPSLSSLWAEERPIEPLARSTNGHSK